MNPGRQPIVDATSWTAYLDRRPIIVAIAGPNGAGKSTFFDAHLKSAGLRFLNTDVITRELELDAHDAMRIVAAIREELVSQRASFVFETVFSDPVGDKLGFLKRSVQVGYAVVLCFIGLASARTSEQRVAMRVSQGGHDVPTEKLLARFPRTLANLAGALRELPYVLVFDNEDLRNPFRHVSTFMNGRPVHPKKPLPTWLKTLTGK